MISHVSVVSHRFLLGCAAVTACAIVLTVLLIVRLALRRQEPRAGDRCADDQGDSRRPAARGRRIVLAALPAVLVCEILVTGLVATRINMTLQLVATIGQISGMINPQPVASSLLGPLSTGGPAGPSTTASPVPAEQYRADLEDEGSGLHRTVFHGPASGVTDEVRIWTPRDYRPDDGVAYDVLVLLHGLPGTSESVFSALDIGPQVQDAIDKGVIPPTIVVAPSLNVDEHQSAAPDCADIVGRAKVGTWVQEDVPRMVHTLFPGTRTDRGGWALAGVSSGGYCAAWTTIMRSDVFGNAGDMSGYNVPIIGGLSDPALSADNTLTTLLTRHAHSPIGLWVMSAADDSTVTDATRELIGAGGPGDRVDVSLAPEGGHSGSLWKEQIPAFLAWWGRRPGAVPGTDAPETALPAPTASAAPTTGATTAALTGTPTAAAAQPAVSRPSLSTRLAASFTGIRGMGVMTLMGLASILLTIACPIVPYRLRDVLVGAGATDRRRALVLAAAGAVLLLAACALTTLTIGLVVNRIGGFYPTWSVAWENIGPAL